MRRSAINYALPLSVIAAFALLLGFALTKLADIERDMRVEATENMLWVIHQARSAALRLDSAAAWRSSKFGDTDLGLRYDVLLSRIDLLSAGPQARYLSALGLEDAFTERVEPILDLEPMILEAQAGRLSATENIHRSLAPLNSFFGRAANAAMVAQWNELGQRLDVYRHAVWQIIASILGIIAIGAFLSIRLLLALREARRTAELERTLERERSVIEYYRGFASMVSHQFRTPLAIIDSSMQRLVRRGERVTPTETAERAAKVRAAIKRLTRLVEGTLDAARFDSGQIEARPDIHDLREIVTTICERWRENATARRILLVFSGDDDNEPVLAQCDPALVEHVMINLISNADKYSHPESLIEVEVYAAGETAFCSVRDQGIGVPADELPCLFERFFRASTASGTPGTGIGLNLARNLARLQGGDVTAVSREGEGSTFTLDLLRAAGTIREATE